jgi:chromate reductase
MTAAGGSGTPGAGEALTIVAIAGSLRQGSLNRRLLAAGVEAIRPHAAVEVVDLKPLDLPLYDGDLEERAGPPPGARTLKEKIGAAHGILLATPEYNHSIPGVLKNAIDWASRPPGNPFRGKVVLLMGASTGQFGALRGLAAVRIVLTALQAHVLPQTVMVPDAGAAFDPAGRPVDPKIQAQIDKACAELCRVTGLLAGR